jgi:hypothetical protein
MVLTIPPSSNRCTLSKRSSHNIQNCEACLNSQECNDNNTDTEQDNLWLLASRVIPLTKVVNRNPCKTRNHVIRLLTSPSSCRISSLASSKRSLSVKVDLSFFHSVEGFHLPLFSFTSFQASRHVQSSLWSSMGIIILALQYLQYRRFSFVPFRRIWWSNSKTVDSWGGSGKGS